jgi:flavin reductase (DIM6/NTAB) family NADH-FMN oxidoreductase RutF
VITLLTCSLSRAQTAALANGVVAPRPIAWVSTLAGDGTPNLAPFSYFNAFSTVPFTIGVGPGSRGGANKDSLRNIKHSGEFTVSVVTEDLATRANLSSAEFDPSVNEWEIAGVTPRRSVTVRPPSVAESPAALECRVLTIVDLGEPEVQANSLVIARVTCVQVDEAVTSGPDYRIDPEAIRLVARMGGDLYCRTRDRFVLRRPTIEEAHAGVSSIETDPDAALGVGKKEKEL